MSCGIQQYSAPERGIRDISYGIQYGWAHWSESALTYRELFDPVENFIRSLILYNLYPWSDPEVQEIFDHLRELYPICKYICIRGNLTHNNIWSLR